MDQKMAIGASLWLAIATPASSAPSITVEPSDTTFDTPVAIQVAGLEPHQIAVIRAHTTDAEGRTWRSHGSYVADGAGAIDLQKQPAISGSYYGTDAMGLFWSMRVAPPVSGDGVYFTYPIAEPGRVDLTVDVDGSSVANAHIVRRTVGPGIKSRLLNHDGFVGRLFEPEDEGRHPAVIVLSGSDGGLGGSSIEAGLLASHGFVALALAYFGAEEVPEYLERIPLEYFKRAIDWLQAQDNVARDQLGVSGISRGGELALLLGSVYPEIKAVVAVSPSHVVWDSPKGEPSWTYKGQPIAHIESKSNVWAAVDAAGRPYRYLPAGLAELEDPAAVARAAIAVEKINGPILLLTGEDDQMWPSTFMANRAVERLREHRHPFEYLHLSYPMAGHTLPIPYIPTTGILEPGWFVVGGTPEGDYRAGLDAWRNELAFLKRHLQ